jgi:hypothetical protein
VVVAINDIDSRQATEAVRIVGSDIDGDETVFIRATQTQDLGVVDTLFSGGSTAAISVGTVPVEAKAGLTRYTNRKILTVMPTNGSVYWGYDSSVTILNGTEIFRNQFATFCVSDNVEIWLVASGNRDVRISEGA